MKNFHNHIRNVHYGRTQKIKYDNVKLLDISTYWTKSQRLCNLCDVLNSPEKYFNAKDIYNHISLKHKDFCKERTLPVCVKCPKPTFFCENFDFKTSYEYHDCEKVRTIESYNENVYELVSCDECDQEVIEVKDEFMDSSATKIKQIELGMISHKKSLITNFGHKHRIKNFIRKI